MRIFPKAEARHESLREDLGNASRRPSSILPFPFPPRGLRIDAFASQQILPRTTKEISYLLMSVLYVQDPKIPLNVANMSASIDQFTFVTFTALPSLCRHHASHKSFQPARLRNPPAATATVTSQATTNTSFDGRATVLVEF